MTPTPADVDTLRRMAVVLKSASGVGALAGLLALREGPKDVVDVGIEANVPLNAVVQALYTLGQLGIAERTPFESCRVYRLTPRGRALADALAAWRESEAGAGTNGQPPAGPSPAPAMRGPDSHTDTYL